MDAMDLDALAAHLTAHSGLPGPRGNLELADAFSARASAEAIRAFADSDDEYVRFCGTQGLGRLAVEDPSDAALIELLARRASDSRWRVREAVARALQIVGRSDPARMHLVVGEWMGNRDAYVRRAALAAICEPSLLKDRAGFQAGLDACEDATASLLALTGAQRGAAPERNLRQALGYCWSVVVAAEPGVALRAFARLQQLRDPDIQWIVSSNLKKNRLQKVLG